MRRPFAAPAPRPCSKRCTSSRINSGGAERVAAAQPAIEKWRPLDEPGIALAVSELAARDPDLAGIAERHGPPPLWGREPAFETLVRIILEQQISLASAEAAFRRLVLAAGPVEPAAIVDVGEEGLRSAGQTRQKSRYLVGLARDVLDGRLDIDA